MDAAAEQVPPAFRERVHARFPVSEAAPQFTMSVTVGAAAQPGAQQFTLHRLLQRDRLRGIALSRDGITLETTDYYPGWSDFRDCLTEILSNLQETSPPDGVLRVGLRYIDEIRVPESPETLSGWDKWVDSRLVGPLTLTSEEPSRATTVLQYGTPPGFVTVARAEPLPEGRVIQPEGHLRMPVDTPAGPFFLLDTDASWADPTRQVPEFDADAIMGIFERLHTSCHDIFEASITDDLREFLRLTRDAAWSGA
jgi:uncharacterized protein (TIGR04255 family)